jgi:hypothetical protein
LECYHIARNNIPCIRKAMRFEKQNGNNNDNRYVENAAYNYTVPSSHNITAYNYIVPPPTNTVHNYTVPSLTITAYNYF